MASQNYQYNVIDFHTNELEFLKLRRKRSDVPMHFLDFVFKRQTPFEMNNIIKQKQINGQKNQNGQSANKQHQRLSEGAELEHLHLREKRKSKYSSYNKQIMNPRLQMPLNLPEQIAQKQQAGRIQQSSLLQQQLSNGIAMKEDCQLLSLKRSRADDRLLYDKKILQTFTKELQQMKNNRSDLLFDVQKYQTSMLLIKDSFEEDQKRSKQLEDKKNKELIEQRNNEEIEQKDKEEIKRFTRELSTEKEIFIENLKDVMIDGRDMTEYRLQKQIEELKAQESTNLNKKQNIILQNDVPYVPKNMQTKQIIPISGLDSEEKALFQQLFNQIPSPKAEVNDAGTRIQLHEESDLRLTEVLASKQQEPSQKDTEILYDTPMLVSAEQLKENNKNNIQKDPLEYFNELRESSIMKPQTPIYIPVQKQQFEQQQQAQQHQANLQQQVGEKIVKFNDEKLESFQNDQQSLFTQEEIFAREQSVKLAALKQVQAKQRIIKQSESFTSSVMTESDSDAQVKHEKELNNDQPQQQYNNEEKIKQSVMKSSSESFESCDSEKDNDKSEIEYKAYLKSSDSTKDSPLKLQSIIVPNHQVVVTDVSNNQDQKTELQMQTMQQQQQYTSIEVPEQIELQESLRPFFAYYKNKEFYQQQQNGTTNFNGVRLLPYDFQSQSNEQSQMQTIMKNLSQNEQVLQKENQLKQLHVMQDLYQRHKESLKKDNNGFENTTCMGPYQKYANLFTALQENIVQQKQVIRDELEQVWLKQKEKEAMEAQRAERVVIAAGIQAATSNDNNLSQLQKDLRRSSSQSFLSSNSSQNLSNQNSQNQSQASLHNNDNPQLQQKQLQKQNEKTEDLNSIKLQNKNEIEDSSDDQDEHISPERLEQLRLERNWSIDSTLSSCNKHIINKHPQFDANMQKANLLDQSNINTKHTQEERDEVVPLKDVQFKGLPINNNNTSTNINNNQSQIEQSISIQSKQEKSLDNISDTVSEARTDVASINFFGKNSKQAKRNRKRTLHKLQHAHARKQLKEQTTNENEQNYNSNGSRLDWVALEDENTQLQYSGNRLQKSKRHFPLQSYCLQQANVSDPLAKPLICEEMAFHKKSVVFIKDDVQENEKQKTVNEQEQQLSQNQNIIQEAAQTKTIQQKEILLANDNFNINEDKAKEQFQTQEIQQNYQQQQQQLNNSNQQIQLQGTPSFFFNHQTGNLNVLGTSAGELLLFNEARQTCHNLTSHQNENQISCRVLAIDISFDSQLLLAGFQNGNILLFNLNTLSLHMTLPSLHQNNAPIVAACFYRTKGVSVQKQRFVSCDSQGAVFRTTVTSKKNKKYSFLQQGLIVNQCAALSCNDTKFTNNLVLLASYQAVVFYKMRKWPSKAPFFKLQRPQYIQPNYAPTLSPLISGMRDTQILIGWEQCLFVYVLSESKKSVYTSTLVKRVTLDQIYVYSTYLSPHQIWLVSAQHTIKLIDAGQLSAVQNEFEINVQKEYSGAKISAFFTVTGLLTHDLCKPCQVSHLGFASNSYFANQKNASVLNFALKNNFLKARMLTWRSFLDGQVQKKEWLMAMSSVVNLLKGKDHYYTELEADKTPLEQYVMSEHFLLKYVQLAFPSQQQRNNQVSAGEQIVQDVIMTCVEFLNKAHMTNAIFGPLLKYLQSKKCDQMMMECLEPFIIKNKLKFIESEALSVIVQHYERIGRYDLLQMMILNLTVNAQHMETLLQVSLKNNLTKAIVYLCSLQNDFLTPLAHLSAQMQINIMQNNQQKAHLYSLRCLWYIRLCLRGLLVTLDAIPMKMYDNAISVFVSWVFDVQNLQGLMSADAECAFEVVTAFFYGKPYQQLVQLEATRPGFIQLRVGSAALALLPANLNIHLNENQQAQQSQTQSQPLHLRMLAQVLFCHEQLQQQRPLQQSQSQSQSQPKQQILSSLFGEYRIQFFDMFICELSCTLSFPFAIEQTFLQRHVSSLLVQRAQNSLLVPLKQYVPPDLTFHSLFYQDMQACLQHAGIQTQDYSEEIQTCLFLIDTIDRANFDQVQSQALFEISEQCRATLLNVYLLDIKLNEESRAFDEYCLTSDAILQRAFFNWVENKLFNYSSSNQSSSNLAQQEKLSSLNIQIIQHLPKLVDISSEQTYQLIRKYNKLDESSIVAQLDYFPSLQLEYFKTGLIQKEQEGPLDDAIMLTHLELLCKNKLEKEIITLLLEKENYQMLDAEQVVEFLKKYNMKRALACKYEQMGLAQQALNVFLMKISSCIDRYVFRLNHADANMILGESLNKSVRNLLALCEECNNEDTWFYLLDEIIKISQKFFTSKRDKKRRFDQLKKLFKTSFITIFNAVISKNAGSDSLGDRISQYDDLNLGLLKDNFLELFSGFKYQFNLLQNTKHLLVKSIVYNNVELRVMSKRGYMNCQLCNVCMQPFKQNEKAVVFYCEHSYHTQCNPSAVCIVCSRDDNINFAMLVSTGMSLRDRALHLQGLENRKGSRDDDFDSNSDAPMSSIQIQQHPGIIQNTDQSNVNGKQINELEGQVEKYKVARQRKLNKIQFIWRKKQREEKMAINEIDI